MSIPPVYPPILPVEVNTLWHGMIMGIGFAPQAWLTARGARGLPICWAICP